METPFGVVYGTNITPDPDTGIGRWSRTAFNRAMRDGIDRAGRNLYPAFPYDHFRRLSDNDLAALYAFVMTRDPVHSQAPATTWLFPTICEPDRQLMIAIARSRCPNADHNSCLSSTECEPARPKTTAMRQLIPSMMAIATGSTPRHAAPLQSDPRRPTGSHDAHASAH